MVAKRFELLHLAIPECSQFSLVKIRYLESGALDRSATQPYLMLKRFCDFTIPHAIPHTQCLMTVLYYYSITFANDVDVDVLVYNDIPAGTGAAVSL